MGIHHLKFVLMLYPIGAQGLIWQAILRSQEISVVWESPDVNLIGSLAHLKAVELPLPDLLLIDTRLQNLNPYHFCRWSHSHCPGLKVVLVNGAQKQIAPSEREWALYQGAAELLPRFQREQLFSGGIVKVRRILDLLDQPSLNHAALISALVKFGHTAKQSQQVPFTH